MKNYFICDRTAWEKFPKEHFRFSHWIATDDPTKLLVVADFHTDSGADFWEGIAGVELLPHVVLGTAPVPQKHAQILSKAIGTGPTDRTVDVARKAAAQHPLFRPDRD